MIAFIAFSALLAVASSQYPYQGQQQSYHQPAQPQQYQAPAQSYQAQPQPQAYQAPQQSYQPRAQPQAYQAPPQSYQSARPQQPRNFNPAAVHYVNIGAELAGDYKFGYDTGKGDGQSFREETRLPDGSVQGAYGYVDESGKQRVIKYTAGKNGFQVEGDGIPKTPPAAAPAAAPAHAAPANNGYNAYGGNQNYGAGGYH